jgi:hypothetical protein
VPLSVTPGTDTATLPVICPARPLRSSTRVPLPFDSVTKLVDPLPREALRLVAVIRAAAPFGSLALVNTNVPLTVWPASDSETPSPSIDT